VLLEKIDAKKDTKDLIQKFYVTCEIDNILQMVDAHYDKEFLVESYNDIMKETMNEDES